MLPGIGKIDPRKMQSMMKQFGMSQQDIEAERVVIEKSDGKIIIENPNVQKIKFQGQESWQISGDSREEASEKFNEEDIKLVMGKTGKKKEQVIKTLEETNDIAEAIMKLSS
ncbi:nascent polypeptide-associated complex protein [Candidatus Pacearchaeota archaeon]|nr:nascent polypeptide-associated complex protein [Candidatus Pacearchaeota archaeon]